MKAMRLDDHASVAVVGLGPGGLAAALEVANRGISVVAFSNRQHYTRTQRIHLSEETIDFLSKYKNDSEQDNIFWNKFEADATVQTKDLERYLYSKLRQCPNVALVEVDSSKELAILSDENNNNYIKIQDDTSSTSTHYSFKHLLGADGAQHRLADQVAKKFNKTINYSPSEIQASHLHHAAIQLQLKENVIPPEERSPQNNMKYMLNIMKSGWEKTKAPNNYIWTNAANTKFSFVGEIPRSIFEEPDEVKQKAALKTWASLAIFEKYGLTEEQLEFKNNIKNPGKNRFHATVFEVELRKADKAVINLHSTAAQGVFAQIGDARQTPFYQYAHGANDAILGAIAFANSLDPQHIDSFDHVKFTTIIDTMDRNLEASMMGIRDEKNTMRSELDTTLREHIDKLQLVIQNHYEVDGQSYDGQSYINALEKVKQNLPNIMPLYELLNIMSEDMQKKHDEGDSFNVHRKLLSVTLNYVNNISKQMDLVKQVAFEYSQSEPDVKINYGA